ncbi:MAG: DUF2723 domain-containing protein, partial [Anaerolineae bacterium]
MRRHRPFDRLDLLLSTILSLISLALYVRTLVPWLLPGDSGEFQVLLHQVGIAHTTGYPVYMLLGKLFITLAAVGDVAYRANLFSAFTAGLTVALVYAAGRLAADSRWGGAFAALTLAVSFTFWSQALIAEVYAPGALFLAAVLVALLAWERTGRAAWLFVAGLCGGLGLGVHASVGVFAPAAVALLLSHPGRWRAWWRPALIGALAGLALYGLAFLIVDLHAPPANIFNAAYSPARSSWGLSEADLQNPLARILFVGGGRQWRTALYPDPAGMLKKVGDYVAKLPREFSAVTLACAVIGFVALSRRMWRVALLLGVGLIVQWLFYFNYHVGDIYVFYIPGYLLLAVLAGAGVAALERLLSAWGGPALGAASEMQSGDTSPQSKKPSADRRLALGEAAEMQSGDVSPQSKKPPADWGLALGTARSLLLVVLMSVALYPVLAPHWPAVIKGEAPFLRAREYPANPGTAYLRVEMAGVVKELERDAIVFVDWGRLYPLYYAAQIDADRFDLQFIEARPRNDTGRLADSLVEFVAAQVGR